MNNFQTFFYIQIIVHFYRTNMIQDKEMSSSVLTLSLYPVILICCWTFTSIVDLNAILNHHRKDRSAVNALALILPASQGLLHSVIFVFRSNVMRKQWKQSYFQLKEYIHWEKPKGHDIESDVHAVEFSEVINSLAHEAT